MASCQLETSSSLEYPMATLYWKSKYLQICFSAYICIYQVRSGCLFFLSEVTRCNCPSNSWAFAQWQKWVWWPQPRPTWQDKALVVLEHRQFKSRLGFAFKLSKNTKPVTNGSTKHILLGPRPPSPEQSLAVEPRIASRSSHRTHPDPWAQIHLCHKVFQELLKRKPWRANGGHELKWSVGLDFL